MDSSEESEEKAPVTCHWFYSIDNEKSWISFSKGDNNKLENAFRLGSRFVDVLGRRFQADVVNFSLNPIYWEIEQPFVLRRSWWYSSRDALEVVPFTLPECESIEAAYSAAITENAWPVTVNLTDKGRIVMENKKLIRMFGLDESGQPHRVGDLSELTDAAKAEQLMVASLAVGTPVKRGFSSEFFSNLPPSEPDTFDHLVFVVHGIGGYCDLRFRTLPECVNDMRQLTERMCTDHGLSGIPESTEAAESTEMSDSLSEKKGSVEFLPIMWHSALHTGPGGLNERFSRISLESCGKLRDFVNDVLLDVLLFTSPVYHQTIIDNVTSEINRVYSIFRSKHPTFNGRVSLLGHSLGSVIVFDILANQGDMKSSNEDSMSTSGTMLLGACHSHNTAEQTKLQFDPFAFFAVGSPLAMFLTVAGVNSIATDYSLPSCKQLYNIFHPFDPVAYRIEPLLKQEASGVSSPPPPVVMPHHRGRKRLHLEVKDVVTKIGSDIKRRVVDSFQSMAGFLKKTRLSGLTDQEVVSASVINEEDPSSSLSPSPMLDDEPSMSSLQKQQSVSLPTVSSSATRYNYGSLNKSQRIDFVLQEGPIEVVNPYLFSIASHLCYWQSEDTCLFIARSLYCHDDGSSSSLLLPLSSSSSSSLAAMQQP